MKFRKILCIVSAVVILLTSLVACGTGSTTDVKTNESTAPATSSASTVADSKTAQPNFEEHYKYTYSSLADWKPEQNALWQEIAKKFNIEIEVLPVTFDNWEEKNKIWLATGDMPDLMMFNLWGQTYPDYKKYAEQEVLKPLPEIDGKYPNLQNILSKLGVAEKLKVNGKLYGWPHYMTSMLPGNIYSGSGIFYRKDWAEKLGIPKDKDTFTMDEFLQLGKDMVSKDPGGLGASKTIGFGSLSWWVPGSIGIGLCSPWYDSYKLVDGKYIWGPTLPETLEGIKYTKKLYDEGVLWKDMFTAKSTDAQVQFRAGQVGILADNVILWNMQETRQKFAEQNPGIDPYNAIGYLHILGPDGKLSTSLNNEYWNATLFNAKMEDKKMERMLYLMDWLAGDEGTKWVSLGIKGKDWEDGADGNPVIKWSKDASGKYIKPDYGDIAGMRHIAVTEGDLVWLDPNIDERNRTDIQKYYDAFKKPDTFVKDLGYDLQYLSTPNKDKFGSYQKDINDEIIKLIVSSKNIDKDWADWLKIMEPKVAPILKEINDAAAKK